MLREIKNPRQIEGELFRRWFHDDNMDLIVWLDESKVFVGFQLTYDKPYSEHALTWMKDRGFCHNRVDDGENRPGRHKGTPLLVPDGMFDLEALATRFLENSGGIDTQVSQNVYEKLLTYSGTEFEG